MGAECSSMVTGRVWGFARAGGWVCATKLRGSSSGFHAGEGRSNGVSRRWVCSGDVVDLKLRLARGSGCRNHSLPSRHRVRRRGARFEVTFDSPVRSGCMETHLGEGGSEE